MLCKLCHRDLDESMFYKCYNRKYDKYYFVYTCKDCRQVKMRAWQRANRDHLSKYFKKYREANGDRVRQYGKKSYYKHREAILAKRKAYRQTIEGRNKWLFYKHQRRHADGEATTSDIANKLEFYGFRCRYCGVDLDEDNIHMDHAIPLSRGGTNWIANLMPCCEPCNRSKYNKTLFEYLNIERVHHDLNSYTPDER